MTVTVTSPATYRELTTLVQLKSELDITETTNDGILAAYIQEATDFIETYCGRNFAKETITETLASDGGFTLRLNRTPIVSVTQIRYNTSTQGSTTFTIDDAKAGILFKETGWTQTNLPVHEIVVQPTRYGRRDWAVDYIGGYTCPGSTELRTLPHDLERACIDLTKTFYFERKADPTVFSKRIGEASITKFPSAGGTSPGIGPQIIRILERYRRMDIVS